MGAQCLKEGRGGGGSWGARRERGRGRGRGKANHQTPQEKQAAPIVITSAHLNSGVIRRAERKQGQHIVLRTLLYHTERSLEPDSI